MWSLKGHNPMMKYTERHHQMLSGLSLKDLQRLYRLRTLKRGLVATDEHLAKDRYPKTSQDHKEINILSKRRSILDSQRWAVEEVIKHKCFLHMQSTKSIHTEPYLRS